MSSHNPPGPEAPRAKRRLAPLLFPAALLTAAVLYVSCYVYNRDDPTAAVPAPTPGSAITAVPQAASPPPAVQVPGTAVTAVTAATAVPEATPATAACEACYQPIREFFDSLPKTYSGIRGEDADRLAERTEATADLGARCIAECGDHVKGAELRYIQAQLLYTLSQRRRFEWIKQFQEVKVPNVAQVLEAKVARYMGEVGDLATAAFEKLPDGHPFRPRALQLTGEALSDAKRYDEARKIYQRFLELYPGDEMADNVTVALARVFLDMGRYEEGIKVTQAGIEKYSSSDVYPYLWEVLWKLYHSKGDLTGMEKYVKGIETVFPLRLSGTDLSPAVRDVHERFLDYSGFRKGYTRFAKGDLAGAREAFNEHIRTIDEKAAKLEAEKKQLKTDVGLYKQRSVEVKQFIDELAGLPAAVDFDLGEGWVTPKRVRIQEAKGKVVAIVFRGINDERSAAFLGPFSQVCARNPEAELVTISYRKSPDAPIAQQGEEMHEELARLGYEGSAGLDPDAAGKKIFRSFQANVGSATFLIANRRGELVWFMQDPRGVDVQFAEELVKDIAKR